MVHCRWVVAVPHPLAHDGAEELSGRSLGEVEKLWLDATHAVYRLRAIDAMRRDVFVSDYALAYDFLDEFERMEPEERQFVLDELAETPELWDEQEVMTL